MTPWPLLAAAYLLGSLPVSLLAGRAVRGVDLRQHGSGNLGATNAWRVLGPRVALPIFVVDLLKGFVPTFYFPRLDASPYTEWALAYGAAAIMGHVFSVWVGFRGGKGIAAAAGVFLGLAPQALGIAFAAWLLVFGGTRIVSVASLAAAATLVAALALTDAPQTTFGLGVAIALFVFWTHRSNIGRLRRGEEPRFGRAAAGGGAAGAAR